MVPTVVREHKIQLEVERKVKDDKVQTACSVACDGLGGIGAVDPGRQSPSGRKIGDKNK